MKPFGALTLAGRARRLRPLALAALAEYDLDVVRLRLLSNSWNCVFRVDTPDRKLVIRVTLPGYGHSPELVRSEAAFLHALATESDIEVPAPVAARDGRLAVSASAPGVPEARMCVVYTWIPGPDLAARISPANWRLHGALHARLHDFAARWTPPPSFQIHDYDRVFHFPGRVKVWDYDLYGHESILREAQAAADALIARVRLRDPVIVTHGDLHHANAKLHRGVLRPIDFEDVMWATRGLDVGTSLYYISKNPDRVALTDAFRAGYSSVAPWPEGEPGEIDKLRFPRALDLLNILLSDVTFRVADPRALVDRIAGLAREVVA